MDHLETLFDTESLRDKALYDNIHNELEVLGKKINLFVQVLETGHLSEK